MPPAADSNRAPPRSAASLENTEQEGEDREEGEEKGEEEEQGTEHHNRIYPILTMKKMQYQGIKEAC